MTYGPSTTNADLSDAVAGIALRIRQHLSHDEFDALVEASVRIEEAGDDE